MNYSPSKTSPIFTAWVKKWRKIWAWLLEICGAQLFLQLKLTYRGITILAA